MKKQSFEITTDIGTRKVEGLVDGTFGIHESLDGFYPITHLKTGMMMFKFIYMLEARRFVSLCKETTFPIPWDKVEVTTAKENLPLARKIYAQAIG